MPLGGYIYTHIYGRLYTYVYSMKMLFVKEKIYTYPFSSSECRLQALCLKSFKYTTDLKTMQDKNLRFTHTHRPTHTQPPAHQSVHSAGTNSNRLQRDCRPELWVLGRVVIEKQWQWFQQQNPCSLSGFITVLRKYRCCQNWYFDQWHKMDVCGLKCKQQDDSL